MRPIADEYNTQKNPFVIKFSRVSLSTASDLKEFIFCYCYFYVLLSPSKPVE